MVKQDIKNFTPEELKQEIAGLSAPTYRAKQILRWLYKMNAKGFEEMTDIPSSLKENLSQRYYIGSIDKIKRLVSKDRTEKILYKLFDRNFIETVLIPTPERETVCVSTQVGCKFGCYFCASGIKGFIRNLTPSEITSQILFLKHDLRHRITNVVFMGMGEPLDNFENVAKALVIINSPEAMNISARRITVSTCGIVPGILRLKELGLQINLSISLHATNDELRNRLMPVNKRYPLKEILEATEDYFKKTKRKIFLEYILFKDINDSYRDADGLATIAKRLKATVNLMQYHTFPGLKPLSTTTSDINRFIDYLKRKKVNVTLRASRGSDIKAACGQLCGVVKDEI